MEYIFPYFQNQHAFNYYGTPSKCITAEGQRGGELDQSVAAAVHPVLVPSSSGCYFVGERSLFQSPVTRVTDVIQIATWLSLTFAEEKSPRQSAAVPGIPVVRPKRE